ncbi:neuronal-specific septin-3 isoform X1 [Macrotis lagotis]|uniref:neuronal-specific septin-3 isoform X1 n=2 Tax=Macrotis lagotis TaxID=92651 RepID=UPI003D690D2F
MPRPERATPGTPTEPAPTTLGTIMDQATPRVTEGSARAPRDPCPTHSEAAIEPEAPARAGEGKASPRSRRVTFFQPRDPQVPLGVVDLAVLQCRPASAPNPTLNLPTHTPRAHESRVVITKGPAKGSLASDFAALLLPLSSGTAGQAPEERDKVPARPSSCPTPVGSSSNILMKDKSTSSTNLETSCTALVLVTPCIARSLPSTGAKIVFTVPGLDTSPIFSSTTMDLPMPRRAQLCTAMILGTSQKTTPPKTVVAPLADIDTAPATPDEAFEPCRSADSSPEAESPLLQETLDYSLEPEEEAATASTTLTVGRPPDLDALDLAVAHKGLRPSRTNWHLQMEGFSWNCEQGSAESKTEVTMSELVTEPRPKPAVPMKPLGISSNLLGYIGIDTIIEQMRKKTMKTGFDFNIMVVGQSGLGKSTLINTLFKSQVSRKSATWNREEKIPKTVEIKAIGHVIEEGGVKMKLTVIDTPGFGDQINNENCWEPIEKYINEQYEKFLKEEVNIARKKRIPDTRVHCCLYFISPTGHSLRPLDLEFMKHLSKVVNIVPIIAKADTMTLEEKMEFKQRVRKELEVNGIEFYPQKEFDEDLEDKTENDKIRQESMPFAVVGSDKEYQVNGKKVLGRKTPWGIIEVENLTHCEFALLRDFVIRTHLQDLKEVTHNIHYETYRARRLNDNGGLPPAPHPSNLTSFKGLEK